MTGFGKQLKKQFILPGKQGSRAYYNNMMVEAAPFLYKDTIEATGAGDTFCGCVLHYICEHGICDLTKDNLREMLVYANAAASLVTTRKGDGILLSSRTCDVNVVTFK